MHTDSYTHTNMCTHMHAHVYTYIHMHTHAAFILCSNRHRFIFTCDASVVESEVVCGNHKRRKDGKQKATTFLQEQLLLNTELCRNEIGKLDI